MSLGAITAGQVVFYVAVVIAPQNRLRSTYIDASMHLCHSYTSTQSQIVNINTTTLRTVYGESYAITAPRKCAQSATDAFTRIANRHTIVCCVRVHRHTRSCCQCRCQCTPRANVYTCHNPRDALADAHARI